jgi:hypothetical protein
MWWQKDDQFLGTFKVVFRPAILEYVKRFVPKVDHQLQTLTNGMKIIYFWHWHHLLAIFTLVHSIEI